jgi:predicted nucleic acid-binding protein
MKKIFLDTNIVVDLLSKREPYYQEAAELFSLADKQKSDLFISALSFANLIYILLRQRSQEDTRSILRKLKLFVSVLNLDDKIISLALSDDEFEDFEDGLQYYSAVENEIDIIISRNLKDFKNSKLLVMTAGQFLLSYSK